MSRYIDADELIKALNDKEVDYRADIDEAIRTTPTADVEQVIRCKDCRRYKTLDCLKKQAEELWLLEDWSRSIDDFVRRYGKNYL